MGRSVDVLDVDGVDGVALRVREDEGVPEFAMLVEVAVALGVVARLEGVDGRDLVDGLDGAGRSDEDVEVFAGEFLPGGVGLDFGRDCGLGEAVGAGGGVVSSSRLTTGLLLL